MIRRNRRAGAVGDQAGKGVARVLPRGHRRGGGGGHDGGTSGGYGSA